MVSVLSFKVKHSNSIYNLSLRKDSTIADLQVQLSILTSVPINRQKLLLRNVAPDAFISGVIKPDSTITLIGTPDAELITSFKSFANTFTYMKILSAIDGRTYITAAIRMLFEVEPIRYLLMEYKSSDAIIENEFLEELKHCFRILIFDEAVQFQPIILDSAIRRLYPEMELQSPDVKTAIDIFFETFTTIFKRKFTDILRIRLVDSSEKFYLSCKIPKSSMKLNDVLKKCLAENKIIELPSYLLIHIERFTDDEKDFKKIVFPFTYNIADLLEPSSVQNKHILNAQWKNEERGEYEELSEQQTPLATNLTIFYDLIALVTHTGEDQRSGVFDNYVCQNSKWFKVGQTGEVSKNKISCLSGGDFDGSSVTFLIYKSII
ncbi:hypothetical protein KAFR_0C02380 [Kazachstania africana CBS 2517]|uniref:ubiquitinyl hydrolase 1 n=1 Tax=Kazachstania africana (strain ATCC 22294 / BCRC 22015 / CBS 2517 / CECT 1963 / NBRC 1671 / NRRL Y-8276) TaxID=1071382 RepID=H2AS81_KAZAF|nr:hypothetical protein KAFR_0C02380 [Kazachstania africana CBS 2517]CCF57231.1 hypothetical protein KAFR_0C02380 [Kazachstania africana CBS 2517]